LSNLNASEREAATAKEVADDKRLGQLQQEYEVELSDKLPESVSYIAAETELAQHIKAQEANVEALRSECETLEANLFPRMSPSVLVSELQQVRIELQAAEKELNSLNDQLQTPSIWASEDELSSISHDLQTALCKMIERAEQQKRGEPTSAKIQQNGLPEALKLDLVVGDIDRQSLSHSNKCAALRARRGKIEALLKAKGVN
jgi:hypothetical protein